MRAQSWAAWKWVAWVVGFVLPTLAIPFVAAYFGSGWWLAAVWVACFAGTVAAVVYIDDRHREAKDRERDAMFAARIAAKRAARG